MSIFKKLFKSKSDTPLSEVEDNGPPAKGVRMSTNLGDITIQLHPDQAPKVQLTINSRAKQFTKCSRDKQACKNFAALADNGKYNNVAFHRIIKGFMIQGGDYTRGDGTGGKSIWGKKFEDEISPSLSHNRSGILSMANSGPKTNGSQFFITLAPCTHLDGKHTIFGQVTQGLDVIETIGTVKTGELDRPVNEIKIIEAKSFT